MEKQSDLKYEYVPDVSHIMGQAGYRMDLMAILSDPLFADSGRNGGSGKTEAKPAAETFFIPELFFYFKNDING